MHKIKWNCSRRLRQSISVQDESQNVISVCKRYFHSQCSSLYFVEKLEEGHNYNHSSGTYKV